EARIALIEAHAGQSSRVDFHRPAVLGAPHEYIGYHVLGCTRTDRCARPRMAGAYERECAGEVLVARTQLPFHDRELPARYALKMMPRNLDCSVESGGRRVELPQLQLDTFTDGPRADSRRVEGLDTGKRRLDLGSVTVNLGPQCIGDLLQRLGEIAVIADGIDDGTSDRELPRLEPYQLELPEQILLQGLTRRIGELLLAVIVIAAPGGFRGSDTLIAPALIEHLDGALPRGRRRLDRLGGRGILEGAGLETFLVPIIHRLEHHIGLEELTDVRLQLESGQLQEPDRLLQLRGHRQLLTQLELQRGFQHAGTGTVFLSVGVA